MRKGFLAKADIADGTHTLSDAGADYGAAWADSDSDAELVD